MARREGNFITDIDPGANNKNLIPDTKYLQEITYEKDGDGFVAAVEISNKKALVDMGKLIEKKEAACLNKYIHGKILYRVNKKLI